MMSQSSSRRVPSRQADVHLALIVLDVETTNHT
jgi:hypothetical protein